MTTILDDLFSLMEKANTGYNTYDLTSVIKNNEDDYVIYIEAPGIKDDNIEINYEKEVLLVTVNYDNEIRKGTYTKSFIVRDIDADKISAKLDSGILAIKLPKSEEKKPKRIKITKG